jgi:hypothetical protein
VPGLRAYRIVVAALRELVQAEKGLTIVQEAGPDPERALHLGALRTAIAELKALVPPEF